MGLAGILTIALIVSADQSYAGIDGLRAVTAYPPVSEQDQAAQPSVPVLSGLSGLLDGIRELPIFGPSPSPVGTALVGGTPSTSPNVAGTGSPTVAPRPGSPSQAPAGASPAPSTPSTTAPSNPAPSATPVSPTTPTPTPTATPTPAPSSTPTPTPSGTPAPLTLATDRGATAVVTLGDLVPGDTIVRTITLRNTGSLVFTYVVSTTQTASTLLWTDITNGLQLTVATGTGTVLYSGPIAGLGLLASTTVLAPGATELLRYTFDFPAGAPDTFQGLLQDLTLVFTATQYP